MAKAKNKNLVWTVCWDAKAEYEGAISLGSRFSVCCTHFAVPGTWGFYMLLHCK